MEVTISKVFDASPEETWKLWVEPEYVMKWWGPDRFSCPSAVMDFREGAFSVVCMRSPSEFGGGDIFSRWEYLQIEPFQRIEFIQNLSDSLGYKLDPVALGMPSDFPVDIRTVVTFRDMGNGQTEMIVTEYAEFGSMTEFAKQGLRESIDKAAAVFAK